uniref:Uncharacterized protein n=1 Tax=Octopus bimaculoides TaxID=37653 RepID=A0A0L8FLT2_OCTBM
MEELVPAYMQVEVQIYSHSCNECINVCIFMIQMDFINHSVHMPLCMANAYVYVYVCVYVYIYAKELGRRVFGMLWK